MGRRYAIVEKKLYELESQLRQLAAASESLQPSVRYEFSGKSSFLKSLLAREMETNAQADRQHLQHIADRLAIVEEAFHNWINFDNPPEPLLDAMPTCSCADECCLEPEQEEEEEVEAEREEEDSVGADSDSATNSTLVLVEEEELKEEGGKEDTRMKPPPRHGRSNKCRLVVAVVTVAAALIRVASSFGPAAQDDFLVPT